ncbi:MAG: sortase [Chloroflexi bacterium]|nr:sortase [Chloroflexota bacterium]
MLAVGALLLTASGGYYAYAQFVKTGRDDLVHHVPRPTLSGGLSSAYIDAEGHAGPGESQSVEVTTDASNPEPRVTGETSIASTAATRTETANLETKVSDAENPTSTGQPGTIQTPTEAPQAAPAYTPVSTVNWSPSSEQISMITGSADGRVGAAIEALLYLQALRPGYVPKYEPEVQVDAELIDPSQNTRRLASVIQPTKDRNPETRGQMVAALQESDFSRTTPSIPEPEFATRMIVQGIGLRAPIEELEVVEEGDSRAWETPKHVVGHIPTTAKPGTSGQGWYFGHLESPISGEGNIFRRLPELAARFKRGEQFAIHLDSGSDRYVYQVYRTDVVHASEFAVSDSGLNDITLVSCWPQYEYSERILVTAALVDIVEIPEAEQLQSSSG